MVFKTRFNTLSKLLAVTSYVLRLAKNLRNTNSKTTAPLTVQELKEPHCWIKTSQIWQRIENSGGNSYHVQPRSGKLGALNEDDDGDDEDNDDGDDDDDDWN